MTTALFGQVGDIQREEARCGNIDFLERWIICNPEIVLDSLGTLTPRSIGSPLHGKSFWIPCHGKDFNERILFVHEEQIKVKLCV
jgi:hypothetical protein